MSFQTPHKQSLYSPLTPRNLNVDKGTRRPSTPKSSIRRISPPRLERVVSDWNLTGTGAETPRRTKKTLKSSAGDRFISRTTTGTSTFKTSRPKSSSGSTSASFSDLEHTSQIAEACGLAMNQRILAFKPEAPESKGPVMLTSQYNRPLLTTNNSTQRLKRRINTVPERVLDAPGIVDDYYLNLLDWSSSNCVAIALERNVYVWNADSGSVNSLLECDSSNYISSIKWAPDGAHIAVGLSDGKMSIYDSETGSKMRSLLGHEARVASLSWSDHMLTSGARNGAIFNSDVRIQKHHVSSFDNHVSEVCGLSWRSDGQQLVSGGNDNLVNIWDARSAVPRFTKTNHTAAVKAVAWCPWNMSLLATGGGSSDRKIHFFSSTSGSRLSTTQCTSQVTSLTWSPNQREIISTHGFPDNQISVHSYSQNVLSKIVDIPAHESRVLHASLSPDGTTLATTSSDENLKFWKVFEAKKRTLAEAERGSKTMDAVTIR